MKSATRTSPTAKSRRRARRGPRVDVAVQYATRSRPVPSVRAFRKWVSAACPRDARVTVRVVGSAEGRALNRHYRGRDYPTNVLTFVMRDRPPYEGDLALCAPVVTREARKQAKSLTAHYAHLTVHGVLHLQGYDHENERDAEHMERVEARILKRLGYPDPYLARSHGRHE